MISFHDSFFTINIIGRNWDNSSAKLKILNFVAIKKKKKFTCEESLERLKFVLGKVSRSVYSKWKISVEVTSIFHSSIHMKVIPLFLSGQLNGRIVEKLIRFHRLLLPFSSLYNSVEEFQSYISPLDLLLEDWHIV